MPAGVFRPYAGVSTGVIVFVKGGRTENVWFYDMTADGYSLDDKRDKVAENDIPDVIVRWRKRNPAADADRTAKPFCVPVKEIRENKYELSVNRYKQTNHVEQQYDLPSVILERLRDLESAIQDDLGALQGMLK
jgi:type I restriction enzyme M protein